MTLVAKPGMLYMLEVSPRTEATVAGMFGLGDWPSKQPPMRTAALIKFESSKPFKR